MPKLKLKKKSKPPTKRVPPKKSAIDEEIERFRASPEYRPLPHDPAAETCSLTGLSHKVCPITYVMSPAFTGWCCTEAATRIIKREPLDKIKSEVNLMFRGKLKTRSLSSKIKNLTRKSK